MKVVLASLDWKSQFPNTKFQINSKHQYPMTKTPLTLPLSPLGRGRGEGGAERFCLEFGFLVIEIYL